MPKQITPKDIENPKRKSGYDHVNSAKSGPSTAGIRTFVEKWKARDRRIDVNGKYLFTGPVRSTPEQAAQDYCDYINGNAITPSVTLKTAGHSYKLDRTKNDPEVEAAYGIIRDAKAQKAGKQGYVYLMVEKGKKYAKIGYSVNPEKRIAEVQTGNPRQLTLVGKIKGTPSDEAKMHAKYIKQNVLQEWFKVTPELLKEFT